VRQRGPGEILKSLKGPFPQIETMPAGGVTLEAIADFFKAGACAVGVGGESCDSTSMKQGRFDEIEELARQFPAAAAKAR
jgi:2-dehydro-3-deoxyphosphogluconate aldolase/(4S)-4-hydroxy-2-oxoglutarate aldolase